MREIKFRAWDKELNRMCDVIQLGVRDIIVNSIEEDEISGFLPIDRFEIMQCTGVKDKNGKEIYEGDIIKNNFEEIIGSIMFADCGYWIKTINKDIFDNTIYHVLGQYDGEVLEKIGNIYENPELLEMMCL